MISKRSMFVVFAALTCAAGPSWANERGWRTPDPDLFAPADRQIPNVPDSRGCIRMCFQDESPCDPPIYKHADGRCTIDF